MLSDDEKARIREEEIFRAEVQKSLIAKPSGRLLSFLNTSLGIWLLSTLVLGLFGWTFAQWQATRANEEQIRKLDAEIETRLEAANAYLSSATPENALLILLNPPGAERALLPEFVNRNLKSLLYELHDRVPFWERPTLLKSLEKVEGFEYHLVDLKDPFVARDFYKNLDDLKGVRWTTSQSSLRAVLYNLWDFSPLVVLVIVLVVTLVCWEIQRRYRRRIATK
jgi:hypothetical protein